MPHQRLWSWRIPTLFLVVFCATFAGCARDRTAGDKNVELTVAAYHGDVSVLIYLAQELGHFEDHGIDVTVLDYTAGKLAFDALLAGTADLATATDFVFVSAIDQDDELRILASISRFRFNELIVRRDTGVTNVADIRGKQIGVLRKSSSEYHLGQFLLLNGLTFDDVEVVDLQPPDLREALLTGGIDAAVIWDPNLYDLANALGAEGVVFETSGSPALTWDSFLLVGKHSWIEKNATIAGEFLAAIIEAESATRRSAGQTGDFLERTFGLDPDYISYIVPKMRLGVELPQSLLLAMESRARWAASTGLIETQEFPNYLDYIYLEPLEALRPEAVTIIR